MNKASEFEINLHRISKDLWQDESGADLDVIARKVTELKTQVDVQRSFKKQHAHYNSGRVMSLFLINKLSGSNIS